MSGFGYQPKPINLLNQKLTLSPETQAMIAEIEAKMAARAWMEAMLAPKWEDLLPSFHDMILRPPPAGPVPVPQPAWLKPGPAAPAPVLPNPGPPNFGTQTPAPGDLKLVLEAFSKTKVVQDGTQFLQNEAKRQWGVFKLEWNAAPTGEKVVMVSTSVVVAASMIAPVLAVRETRVMAFDLLKDKWLPVPGVPGYKIKLLDHGAGVTVPLPVRGLTFEAESQFLNSGAKPTTVMLQFDLMEFWGKKK
ncbi:MAG: hypothetical protein U1A24_14195 [Cypionkella sp.]|uniref:hypothetical protein n=1 Tax=Cypionkella sp. TaxID=2811411 RepID=UPI002ABA7EE5|nr:hypothetical protein [Cypionkella sp.]MDZ4311692.1 hypothetical protein [Cypionkella sp.]MDZ4395764.1 hypothetical protein [Cypionkella sp.]